MRRLLRRGLDRGYIGTTEEIRSPRGKLRLDLMIKQQSVLRRFAICDVDELTPDVLHNQILRASLASLANCVDVDIQIGLKSDYTWANIEQHIREA